MAVRCSLGLRLGAAALVAALSFCGMGCRNEAKPAPPVVQKTTIAPGIVFYQDDAAGVQLIDVDLKTANARPVVVAEGVKRLRNNFIGDCKTPEEWAEKYNVVAAMNAGFFGETFDEGGRRKGIVQLAVVNGKVVAPGSGTKSTRNPGQTYYRAALGFSKDGTPEIAWASGTTRTGPRRYDSPVNPKQTKPWLVASAVACGPRLFENGKRRITDKEERLVSPGKLPRAFVAYDIGKDGRPRHLLIGRADAMDFADCADLLTAYFQRTHNNRPHDALCMDGGASAQIAYRKYGKVEDVAPTGVTVPTAILLLPR